MQAKSLGSMIQLRRLDTKRSLHKSFCVLYNYNTVSDLRAIGLHAALTSARISSRSSVANDNRPAPMTNLVGVDEWCFKKLAVPISEGRCNAG